MRVEVPSSAAAFSMAGQAQSNGSSVPSLRKATRSKSSNGTGSSNGKSRAQPTANGSSPAHVNGSTVSSPRLMPPDYFGHDREEVTRILIQSLDDLGYHTSATTLSRESGFEVESPAIAAFRHAVLQGEWAEAEALLSGLPMSTADLEAPTPDDHDDHYRMDIVLADGADKKEMLFSIRQQKYLELLEERDLGTALMVLRQELTPLHKDIGRLHALSSLMMCQSAEDLKSQANWDGAAGRSRRNLLSDLSASISPSVMIPERRLAILLHKVKQNQISNCLYHNTTTSPSLYSDHLCDRSQFPLQTLMELDQHSDEVWYLQFSNDGTRLATAARDGKIIIYEVPNFAVTQVLADDSEGVIHVDWSPDDKKLLSSTHSRTARLWDIETGNCLVTIDQHTEPVTSCSWAPDGQTFVSGSLDRQMPMCLWDLKGTRVHAWSGNYRVRHCCITPDGRRLVAISMDKRIHVYDFRTREVEYSITMKSELSCLSISRDSRYMLVNVGEEIQLLDIETAEVIRRFLGQKQAHFVVRSSFGGAGENFVVSGSEDSRIYIWHRENGTLVETLEGHRMGCVNGVAWNPKNPRMFASAGDDHKVRIWSNPSPSRTRGSSTNGYHL